MSPKCIVVVAQDPEARRRASAALPPDKLAVLCAADTEQARDLDIPELPAVVVLDASLPGEQAAGFGNDLRADQVTRDTPLLVLAGVDGERAALRWGATAFLAPELPAEELAQAVSGFLDEPRATSALHQALAPLREGNARLALSMLERVAEEEGHTVPGAWARYYVAQLLEAQGNRQFASEELDALLAEHPTFWRAQVRLGILLGSAGDAEHAPSGGLLPHLAPAAGEKTTAAELERVVAAPAPPAGAPDIVVADDSELALEMIVETLEGAGFRVRAASDGAQALALAAERRPDLMVLDGLMPGKTGFDVCKEVKEGLYPSNPPKVFILSAIYTKTRQRHEAADLYKVDEVIAKPFDSDRFVALVRRHLALGAEGPQDSASADVATA